MLSKERISRREFMTRASALGLRASLSPAVLTTSAHAQKPKKGGRLRRGIAGGSGTDSLEPGLISAHMAHNINW